MPQMQSNKIFANRKNVLGRIFASPHKNHLIIISPPGKWWQQSAIIIPIGPIGPKKNYPITPPQKKTPKIRLILQFPRNLHAPCPATHYLCNKNIHQNIPLCCKIFVTLHFKHLNL